jgi:membrane-associated phospholipid phosphatase
MFRDAQSTPLPTLIDSWGRWFLRTYFIGSMLTLCSFTPLTLVADFPGPYWLALLMAAFIVPVIFVAVGLPLRLRALRRGELRITPTDPNPPPGWRGAVSQMRWLITTVVMFGAWPGFYFVASQLGALQEPVQFHFAVDERMPLYSQFTPVYTCIYWFFIFPALYGEQEEHLWALLRGYGSMMVICSAVFVLYPVSYPRDPLVIRHLGDWNLAIIHGADPPINCFPSSHCAVATFSALALREVRPSAFLPGVAMALGICAGTLLTHQHYLIDTVVGMMLGGGAYLHFFRPELARRLVSGVTARR